MNPRLQILCCALTLFVSSSAAAQLVNIRTAPVNVSEQFYTFPSQYLGMGGGIALRDLEADPFANPASAARIHGGIVTGTPMLYTLPDNSGFARTMAVSVFGNDSENLFGGVSLAAQELESAQRQSWWGFQPTSTRRSERFAQNFYSFGLLGQQFNQQRSAVALSMSYANIDALHMVDLLYPEATAIKQGGRISDVRLGFLHEFAGDRSLEAVLVRNHVDMAHTVTYQDWVWVNGQPTPRPPRLEYNADKTTAYGAHLGYRTPVPQSRWQLAGFMTANTKTHPKIPNYNFSHIPRDPGNSWAMAFGVGALFADSATLLSLDLTYMPIWTSTWAEAASPLTSRTGTSIPVGAPTIENEFVFSNWDMHAGWQRRFDVLGVQLGLDVLNIRYWLDQYDNVNESGRQTDASWSELTLSWGLTLDVKPVQLRYFGHHKGGSLNLFGGEQGVPIVNIPPTAGGGPDIVAAPGGMGTAMSMDPTVVVIHQFGVSIPFGRKR